jgi:hypothetical protein
MQRSHANKTPVDIPKIEQKENTFINWEKLKDEDMKNQFQAAIDETLSMDKTIKLEELP